MKFKPHCQIQYDNNILKIKEEVKDQIEVIIPESNLTLEKLTTSVNKQLLTLLNEGTEEKRFWEIQRTAKRAEEHRGKETTSENIIIILSVVIGFLAFGVVLILAFLCYFRAVLANTPDVIELSVQTEAGNIKDPSSKKALLRFIE